MSKLRQWKTIFGPPEKERVVVQVGKSDVEMTDTQAYRFEELQNTRQATGPSRTRNVFEQQRYTVEEAAFRLMYSEDALLKKAADGKLRVFINVAGQRGRWRSYGGGNSRESSEQTLRSGYLALTANTCLDLLENTASKVTILEYVRPADPSALELDSGVLAAFSSWGAGNRFFCLQSPVSVGRDDLVLMAPLQ